MRVFISYRHSTSGYLAYLLRERLQEQDTHMEVFLDEESIRSGRAFPDVIEREIKRADVLLALVGPGWLHRESQDENYIPRRRRRSRRSRVTTKYRTVEQDYVLFELGLAAENHKKVIPILHSGARPIRKEALPRDLRWFAALHTHPFGKPADFERDVEGLTGILQDFTPELAALRHEVWSLYEQQRHHELLSRVEQAWAQYKDHPSSALADCCRIAALTRTGLTGEAGDRDLWLARAIGAAHHAGASNVLAMSLLPFFFRLLDKQEYGAARLVIQEIDNITDHDDPSQIPPADTMRRLNQEKVAHSYLVEGRLEEAQKEFEKALLTSRESDDVRGECKNIGGVALCRYLLGEEQEAQNLSSQAADMASRGGFVGFAAIFDHNLEAMAAGATTIGTGPLQLWTYEVV